MFLIYAGQWDGKENSTLRKLEVITKTLLEEGKKNGLIPV